MDRGIYTASSAGLLSARRIDLVGHNIANVETIGYKAERLVSRQQEFADTLASVETRPAARAEGDLQRTPGVVDTHTVTDFTPGPIKFTGNPLHVALPTKNQFFVVQTPQGEQYTKAGNFTLNAEGQLITPDGMPVLGEGGPITVNGASARISGNGAVLVDGASVGKLRVVEFQDLAGLERKEASRFTRGNGPQPSTVEFPELVQNSVEMANTAIVQAMVEMISAQKSFESYAKTVQTISELNDVSLRTSRVG